MATRKPRESRKQIVWTLAVLGLVAGCGGGGGGSSPTDPPMPTPAFGSARFELAGAGYDGTVSYDDGVNLVFCRTGAAAGWADVWIRFAESAAGDGEAGPHLDLDLCEVGDGGVFTPKDPMAARCDGGKTFDAWWHGGNGDTFVNRVSAASCSLDLDRSGGVMSGTFECRDLRELNGSRSLDLLGGSFECAEE